MPPALSVPLGSSGSAVDVVRNEDGTYSVNGEVITAETMVTAANGNVYRAILSPEGIPVGVDHVAAMQDVMLGDHGGSVTLTQAEDMSWWYGETAVASGYVHTATNGNMYALTLDSEGMWSAMYQQVEVTVALGTQGPITLVRAEDMSWWLGSDAVDVGSEVMSPSGNTYTLWYTDGVWSARFEPESMMIEGTGLVAMTREGDEMYDVEDATLPASGMGDIDTSMGTYRVTMMDGMLMGTRLDKVAIDGNTDDWNTAGMLNGQARAGNPNVSILVDEDDTEDVNEAATALVVDGEEHPFSALLGSGMSQTTGTNFVAEARDDLMEIRDRIEAVLDVFDDDTQSETQIRLLWGAAAIDDDNRAQNVEDVLHTVFGSDNADLIAETDAPDADEALDQINDLIQALSSVDGLATALGDDGVLKELGVGDGGKTATQIFDAVASESTVSYGALGMTRFGAVSKKERTNAVSDAEFTYDTDDAVGVQDGPGVLGGFSFGVTAETVRSRHVMSAGNAYYEGATLAVDQGGTHYSGDISVRVRFVTSKVDGLVTNLRSADGDPWVYLFDDVETIVLPTQTLTNVAEWNGGGQASVSFALRAGSPAAQELDATFSGILLGTGDNAGFQSVGTWSVGEDPDAANYLAGGFGAERVADEPDRRPEVDDGAGVEAMLSGSMATLEDGKLTLEVAKYGWTRTGELADNGSTYEWAQQDNPDTDTPTDATREYEIDLAWLAGREGFESNVNGPKYVDMAREMIETERAKLAALLDTEQLADAQENVWQRIQEILLVYVFDASATGDWNTRLPNKVSGDYDADTALDTVDDILHALSSLSNLEAALDPQESALFVGKGDDDDEPFTNRDAVDRSDIWNEKDSQVKLWIGKTDFTRFGVWRVRRVRNALRSGNWDNEGGKEAYAYSPLPAAKITASNAPNYPLNATANYQGRTVAFAGTAGYEGDVNVRVDWNNTGEDIGATVQTVLSNLQNANGDRYINGSDWTNNEDIREIVFPLVTMTVGDDDVVDFATAGGTATVYHVDRSVANVELDLTEHNGTFVGSSSDGPLGLIGTYRTGAADAAAGTTFVGAYGADLP